MLFNHELFKTVSELFTFHVYTFILLNYDAFFVKRYFTCDLFYLKNIVPETPMNLHCIKY